MLKRGIVLLLILISNAYGFVNNYHFYQANRFWGEPRFERPKLTTFDIFCGGGSAEFARNSDGDKTPLFNIYGPNDLQHLAQGLALDPSKPTDKLLLQLNELPDNGCFGKVLIGGELVMHEARFDLRQNFDWGFYSRLYVPVRTLHIHPAPLIDLSPDTGFPNSQTPQWRTLLLNIDAILRQFDLTLAGHTKRWFGDSSFSLGWTKNYQNTEYVDFVDGTLEAGFLFPTGRAADPHFVFDLPTGHNHHWGGGLTGFVAVGLWEWLTLGGTTGALFLADRTSTEHIKTGAEQQGFVKLAQAQVTAKPGVRWHVSGYVKADHLNEVFSFILGYSFVSKTQEHLVIRSPLSVGQGAVIPEDVASVTNRLGEPLEGLAAVAAIANTASALKPWNRHTIHVQFEFDFADEFRIWHPHIFFSYDHTVGGVRIYQLSVGGATFGMDVTW